MTNTLKDVFPETASCGFREESGSWDIDVGVPDDLSASSLNNCTVTMIRSFLSAFHALCRPVQVEFDTITFDASGRVKEVKEGQIIQIAEKSHDQLLQELLLTVGNDDYSYFTDIFVDCSLQVFVPSTKDTLHQVWVPQSAMFYLGYVLEPNEEDILVPVDASVRFETSVDVWVERTLSSISLQGRDNHACAVQNQPLLEEALKNWERLVGKPIIEWSSRSYRDQVFKYGFKINQNEMSNQNNFSISVGVNYREINTKKLAGTINEAEKQNLAEAATEIRQLLEQLAQTYPTHAPVQKIAGVTEFIEWIASDPAQKQLTINEAKKQNLAEVVAKIRQFVEQWSQTYPTYAKKRKMKVKNKVIRAWVGSGYTQKQPTINAAKKGTLTYFQKDSDKLLNTVVIETIESEEEAEDYVSISAPETNALRDIVSELHSLPPPFRLRGGRQKII
jgi:hypothetical protein